MVEHGPGPFPGGRVLIALTYDYMVGKYIYVIYKHIHVYIERDTYIHVIHRVNPTRRVDMRQGMRGWPLHDIAIVNCMVYDIQRGGVRGGVVYCTIDVQ